MVDWSSIANFAGAALSGFNFSTGGKMNLKHNKWLMQEQANLQKDYTKWLNENSYSQMRTGLENAGYNPLLAVGATPQNGSIGLGSVGSGNTASFDGQKAIEALNTLAETAKTKTGVLGSILGTDIVNTAKGFLNKSGIAKGVEKLIRKSLNTANGAIDTIDKVTDKIDDKYKNFTLKGYVSNTANSRFNYRPDLEELSKLPPELSKYK